MLQPRKLSGCWQVNQNVFCLQRKPVDDFSAKTRRFIASRSPIHFKSSAPAGSEALTPELITALTEKKQEKLPTKFVPIRAFPP